MARVYADSDEGEYYDSDYDDGPQAPDRLDKEGRNLPARLNISINYTPTWGFDEGIRELLQNWRDGMLEIPWRNISIAEISIEFQDRKPRSGTQFEFLAYDSSTPRQLLGKISFQSKMSSSGVEKSTLEILNRFITLDKEHLSMGDSSKKFKREFAGGHGEGMKVGINALLRDGFSVDFFTNHHKWRWNHYQGRELRVNFSKPKGKKDAARVSSGDLHVVVKGGAMDPTFFDRFLFLRVPTDEERIHPADPVKASQLGSVLVADKYLHKLYVAGLFVQDHEGDNGLHYGYDIPKLRLTRDREATNAHKLGEVICKLWNDLLLHSPPARTRFLDLFETSPSCLDISNARYEITEEVARVLLEELKESNPGCWFCNGSDADLETIELIIRNALKQQPKRLPISLWWIFHDRFRLVKGAKQERIDRFKAAPPTRRISCPSEFASHTIHLLRIFLALDEETRAIQVSFVSADGDSDLEYVFENLGGSYRCLVNDSLLRPTALDHPACMHFHSLSDEDENVPDDFTCSCSAIKLANLIYEEALAKRSPDSRHRLNFFRQNLVQWIPLAISAETTWSETTDEIQNIKLSWSTGLSTTGVTFIVVIDEMPSEILKIEDIKDTKQSKFTIEEEAQSSNASIEDPVKEEPLDIKVESSTGLAPNAKPIDYQSVSINGVKRASEADAVREVARIKTSEPSAYFVNFQSGHKYRVQVQADQDLRLQDEAFTAPPSRPFFIYGPLSPPQELSVRWENVDQLSVTWKPSKGATAYELVFLDGDGEDATEPIRVLDAQLGWTGLPNSNCPTRVKVQALGVQGLASERYAEADIPRRLSPPEEITMVWQGLGDLNINWKPAIHAEKYEIRFHQDEATYSVEVFETHWIGAPRAPAPNTISIRSIRSSEIQSDYSPEIAIPNRPGPRLASAVRGFADPARQNANEIENGVFRVANPLDVDEERNEYMPRYHEDQPLSSGATSNGEVDDILRHKAPAERGQSSRDDSPPASARHSREPVAFNGRRGSNFNAFDDREMAPMPLYEPQSDSSDDEDAGDGNYGFKGKPVDEFDFRVDHDASEVTQPFTGGRAKRSMFNRSDYEVLNNCRVSGIRLSVGDLFEFKRRRNAAIQPANAKETVFLGKVLDIHKLKSSGKVLLQILHWVYFNQWFNAPSGDWNESPEDAMVLLFEDENAMGTVEDAQVIEEADLEWCSPARYQKLVYKNAFDSSAAPAGTFVCRVSASVSSAFTILPLAPHLSGKEFRYASGLCNLASTGSLDVADLFCGAGGLSLGFKQAGFDIKHGVDRDVEMLNAFSVNFPGATKFAQPVEDFIQDCKSKDQLPSFNPSLVLVSPSWSDFKINRRGADSDVDETEKTVMALASIAKELNPPYLVCAFGPRKNKSCFNQILLQLLQQGYSFSYKHLDSRQYDCANNRTYLILLAARGDYKLPEWPEPSITDVKNYTTVQQVIADLNFENKRAGNDGVTSDYLGSTFCENIAPELLSDAARKLRYEPFVGRYADAASGGCGMYWVMNHVTGRRERNLRGVVNPDAPLPAVNATPTYKHWERGDLLTVRELARIMSFPDNFKFLGSLESQYRQVGNSTPPSLARAIAEKIMQRLKEQQAQAIKIENGIAPKMEALDDKALLMDADSRPGPSSSSTQLVINGRKRRLDNDDSTATQRSGPSATYERTVRPRHGPSHD